MLFDGFGLYSRSAFVSDRNSGRDRQSNKANATLIVLGFQFFGEIMV